MEEAKPYMDRKVLNDISGGRIETFETFDVMAFDWYDVGCAGGLKRYYGRMEPVFDGAASGDNALPGEDTVRRFAILSNRTDRYLKNVSSLRESGDPAAIVWLIRLFKRKNWLCKLRPAGGAAGGPRCSCMAAGLCDILRKR